MIVQLDTIINRANVTHCGMITLSSKGVMGVAKLIIIKPSWSNQNSFLFSVYHQTSKLIKISQIWTLPTIQNIFFNKCMLIENIIGKLPNLSPEPTFFLTSGVYVTNIRLIYKGWWNFQFRCQTSGLRMPFCPNFSFFRKLGPSSLKLCRQLDMQCMQGLFVEKTK